MSNLRDSIINCIGNAGQRGVMVEALGLGLLSKGFNPFSVETYLNIMIKHGEIIRVENTMPEHYFCAFRLHLTDKGLGEYKKLIGKAQLPLEVPV